MVKELNEKIKSLESCFGAKSSKEYLQAHLATSHLIDGIEEAISEWNGFDLIDLKELYFRFQLCFSTLYEMTEHNKKHDWGLRRTLCYIDQR